MYCLVFWCRLGLCGDGDGWGDAVKQKTTKLDIQLSFSFVGQKSVYTGSFFTISTLLNNDTLPLRSPPGSFHIWVSRVCSAGWQKSPRLQSRPMGVLFYTLWKHQVATSGAMWNLPTWRSPPLRLLTRSCAQRLSSSEVRKQTLRSKRERGLLPSYLSLHRAAGEKLSAGGQQNERRECFHNWCAFYPHWIIPHIQ